MHHDNHKARLASMVLPGIPSAANPGLYNAPRILDLLLPEKVQTDKRHDRLLDIGTTHWGHLASQLAVRYEALDDMGLSAAFFLSSLLSASPTSDVMHSSSSLLSSL